MSEWTVKQPFSDPDDPPRVVPMAPGVWVEIIDDMVDRAVCELRKWAPASCVDCQPFDDDDLRDIARDVLVAALSRKR